MDIHTWIFTLLTGRTSETLSKSQMKIDRAARRQAELKEAQANKLVEAKVREELVQRAQIRRERREEFQRQAIERKIQTNARRLGEIEAEKLKLLQRRQQTREQAQRQRQEIRESVAKMKITKKVDLVQVRQSPELVPPRADESKPVSIQKRDKKTTTEPVTQARRVSPTSRCLEKGFDG